MNESEIKKKKIKGKFLFYKKMLVGHTFTINFMGCLILCLINFCFI